MRFSELIKIERKKRGWTQKEAAHASGIKYSKYVRIESYTRRATFETGMKVLRAYNIPWETISQITLDNN